MDLKCKRVDCVYNKNYACIANGILVKTDLECKTFKKNKNMPKEQKSDVSKDMFSEIPEIHPYRHSRKIDIDCKAKCLFNDNGDCRANGITVCNTKTTAICVTNIKP